MNATEFHIFRIRLNKSSEQLASLLGVSLNSILQYESSKRIVPGHIEKQLFFLISRTIPNFEARNPCWIIKNCPENLKKNCPAWEFKAGHICWFISGTICKGKTHKSWNDKMAVCRECPVLTTLGTFNKDQDLENRDTIIQKIASEGQFEGIIGKDYKMVQLFQLIQDISNTDTTVSIQGESGTGKEVVAKAIHKLSQRKDKPFVVINCAAYPDTLLESELFGYEKGAFTGASKTKIGRFELANEGTVFLDEIGDISPSAQIKLLRVLETKKFERLGSNETKTIDVRFITATNKILKKEVEMGTFREDLFYRLNVIPIFLPPLRDKKNDIPLLVNHFIQIYADKLNKNLSGTTKRVEKILCSHHWPGNIRELENCIEHAVVLSKGKQIILKDLPEQIGKILKASSPEVSDNLGLNEKLLIEKVLNSNNWNKKVAATVLGISRSTLYDKIKKHQIIIQKKRSS